MQSLLDGLWQSKKCDPNLTLNANTGVVFHNVGTVLRYLVPIDNIPPVGNIFGSTVLVLQVVGVFPDIQSENGEHDLVSCSLHQRVVLVGSSHELEFISLLVDTDPDPTGSKEGAGGSTGFKLGLHLVETSKGLVDEFFELSRRLGLLGIIRGCHFVPEEGVVVVTTTVVADSRTGFNGGFHQVDDGFLVLSFRGLVNVGNIRSMMLVVVDLHGGSVNKGLKGFKGIRQVGNAVGVGGLDVGNGHSSSKDSSSALLEEFTTRSGGGIW